MKQRVSKKYVKSMMKFVIECPNTVQEAMALDKKNSKTLCYDAIVKEICSVRVAFGIRGKGDTPPPGHQFIKCHIIFNVKM